PTDYAKKLPPFGPSDTAFIRGIHRSLHRLPGGFGLVKLIAPRVLKCIFRGSHGQVPFAILLSSVNGLERNSYVLLADPEEAANGNHESIDFAVLIQKNVADFANFRIRRVIDVLLVEVGDGRDVLRQRG